MSHTLKLSSLGQAETPTQLFYCQIVKMASSPSPSSSSSHSSACKLMYAFLTDDIFNNEKTCIILNQNSLSYRNFGRCLDVVEKYSYGDVAGLRKPDKYMKMYSQYEDRGEEGDCIVKHPPHYFPGPTIVTLITQYGIGRPIEDNNIASKIVKNSRNNDLVSHLTGDSMERRCHLFNRSMFKLCVLMSSSSRDYIKNIIIPVGIGRSGKVDDIWLTKYLPVIHSFSLDMEKLGKRVILTLTQNVKQVLDEEFKHRNDNVVFHYKSIFVNLPVLAPSEFVDKSKVSVKDDSDWEDDLPNTQPYYVLP